jgi:hypothetical protein
MRLELKKITYNGWPEIELPDKWRAINSREYEALDDPEIDGRTKLEKP